MSTKKSEQADTRQQRKDGETILKVYNQLLNTIDNLIVMFQDIVEKTPDLYWWSITVSENIRENGNIYVSLYRWSELLQHDYVEKLCNLGGIGNKDSDRWILYAVGGKEVTLEDYRKVADVCASTVKALRIPEQPNARFSISEYYDGFIKHITPSRHNKFVDMHESSLNALWITEQPLVYLNASEYFNSIIREKNNSSDGISSTYRKSFWILYWFEFIYNTAQEQHCPIRTDSGSQFTSDLEYAEIPFRRIDNSICEASILALKFLRTKIGARKEPQTPTVKLQKQYRIEKKNIIQLLKIIAAIVGFLAALLTCLYLIGLLKLN